jgi:hypothetical protein
VDHVTIYRWVQRLTPGFIDAVRLARHAPGDRWFVDETYVRQCCVSRSVRMVEHADGMIWLSHGRRELVEGCLDAVAAGDVGGDFVVAAAQILDEGMPGGNDPRGPVPPEYSITRSDLLFRLQI